MHFTQVFHLLQLQFSVGDKYAKLPFMTMVLLLGAKN
jgi:hypothetical protein